MNNNNKLTLDFAKNCNTTFSVNTLQEVLNWQTTGTYEDYKPLFNAAGISIGSRNYLYCLSKFGNAVFSLEVTKEGLIKTVSYFCDFNHTEETSAAKAKLTYRKFNFKF